MADLIVLILFTCKLPLLASSTCLKKLNSVQKRSQQGCRVTERPVSQMADLIVFFGIHEITPFGLVNMF